MSDTYFPTDVSVRVEGDLAEARQLAGLGRNLLFKALQQKATGGVSHVTLVRKVPNSNATVTVILAGTAKIVILSTGKGPVDTVTTEPAPSPPKGEGARPIMYSGVVHEGVLKEREVDGETVCSSFHPTPYCAQAHEIPFQYHDPFKLGLEPGSVHSDLSGPAIDGWPVSQLTYLKASMYSGAMKRVIQAIQGLGRIRYRTPANVLVERDVKVEYDYKWARTHGIVKAGQRNHWLVEISINQGVIAMPLPLLEGTTSASYREVTRAAGDFDALAVLEEFGGLPSGETFPTGVDLLDAITAGTVLRLISEDDLDPYYAVWGPYGATLGWAFSDTGTEAHNTCQRYASGDGPMAGHYAIRISLTEHNRTPPTGQPVGIGSAVLIELFNDMRLSRNTSDEIYRPISAVPYYLPTGVGSQLALMDMNGGLRENARTTARSFEAPYRVPLNVFFVGDRLEVLYWENLREFLIYEIPPGSLITYMDEARTVYDQTLPSALVTRVRETGSFFGTLSDRRFHSIVESQAKFEHTINAGYTVNKFWLYTVADSASEDCGLAAAPPGTREAYAVYWIRTEQHNWLRNDHEPIGPYLRWLESIEGYTVTENRFVLIFNGKQVYLTDPKLLFPPTGSPIFPSILYLPLQEDGIQHYMELVVNANGTEAYVYKDSLYTNLATAPQTVTQVGPLPYKVADSIYYTYIGHL